MKGRFPLSRGRWRWALSLLIAIAVTLLIGVTVWAAGMVTAGQSAAGKLAKLHQVDAQATAAANSWHAPKSGPSTPAATPASCPRTSPATGIYYGDTGDFHDAITNDAVSAPSANQPYEYIIFAGATSVDPQQGILIVTRLDADPCASGAIGMSINRYDTPSRQGAATLTAIVGDELSFTTAGGGGEGQFNFVSGQFT